MHEFVISISFFVAIYKIDPAERFKRMLSERTSGDMAFQSSFFKLMYKRTDTAPAFSVPAQYRFQYR